MFSRNTVLSASAFLLLLNSNDLASAVDLFGEDSLGSAIQTASATTSVAGQQEPIALVSNSTVTCDDSCCDSCCCTPCCVWTANIGFVHMWREDTSNVALIGASPSPPPFSTSQFDFDGSSGLDASLAYECECKGFEIRYLWLDDFDASESLPIVGPAEVLTNPPTGSFFTGGQIFNFDYNSEIQSVEVLGRKRIRCTTLSYGFRYVELNEDLAISVVNTGAGDSFFNFAADNDLYGFQLGVARYARLDRLRLDGGAKAGIYYNDIDATSMLNVPGDTTQNGRGSTSDDEAAFLAELRLRASYDLTCKCSVNVGYQLLFLDGISLASAQVPNTGSLQSNNNTPVSVTQNSILFHGLTAGFSYLY